MRWEASPARQNGGGKCCYEYVGEHLKTSGSLLGSMSIAKLTSIRTVIRSNYMRDEWQIDCSDHGPGVQRLQHGRNERKFTLLVPVVPVGVNSPGSMQTKPNQKLKIKTTCNTSQLSKSIGSKESKGSNLRYLDSGCHDTLEATTMCYTSCAEPILFV